VHDLSPSATVLYASDSIEDILGYEPEEVVGMSFFDYLHAEELSFARTRNGESIHFDHAAVLSYCRCVVTVIDLTYRLKNKQQEWIECECVFTAVYDVFIAATTLYKQDQSGDGIIFLY
jgi:PAS domain-containing protein